MHMCVERIFHLCPAIHTQGKDVADAGLTSGGNEEGTDRRYMGGHIPSKLFHTLQKSVGASTQLQPIPGMCMVTVIVQF